jgi:DNA (cytosine-5)-methyltransferase 1
MTTSKENIIYDGFEIPILSFFTGAGFLDLGFIQAGFKIIWHNENNLRFAEGFEFATHQMGFSGSESIIQNKSSIENLKYHKIIKEAFNESKKPDIFGIIGGPPCPDFSEGGKNKGKEGDHGRLSKIYVEKIIQIKPAFFVFENVPGLIRTRKHRDFLGDLLTMLSIDFYLDCKILNALDFGIPQDRSRVFIIGIKKEKNNKSDAGTVFGKEYWEKFLINVKNESKRISSLSSNRGDINSFITENNWFPWPINPYYWDSKNKYEWPKTTEINSNPEKPISIPTELTVGSAIFDDNIESLPNSDDAFTPHSQKFNWILEGDVSRKSFKRLHRWRYSPAVAYGNNEVHIHPTEPRRLTVREAMRLQTVPDEYSLPFNIPLSLKFKMIGNGVPVKLSKEIAIAIRKYMEKK